MVHQHFRLVDRFTVAENVVLGDPDQARVLDYAAINDRVRAIGEQFGLPIDPTALIADLTVGQRQRVEIVKVLYRGADVLLLDEPTAVLTPPEVEALFVTVRAMTQRGKSVVFISHKLGEVMDISDRVTVMRGGEVTGEVATSQTTASDLARLMVGRPVEIETRRGGEVGAVALHAAGLRVALAGEQPLLDGVALEVRCGEVLGVAGVAGNGQRELAEVLAGMRRPNAGTVTINGIDTTTGGVAGARRAGLAFVPEDRLGTGLVPGMSLIDNVLLTRKRPFWLDRRSARAEVDKAINDFEIKAPGADSQARVLSGGNAQKALLARELAAPTADGTPKVIVVASPTRGLDVGAAEFVRSLLHEARLQGGAVLLISEDLDEIRSLADRIVVMYRGAIACEGATSELTVETIGAAMAGLGQRVGS